MSKSIAKSFGTDQHMSIMIKALPMSIEQLHPTIWKTLGLGKTSFEEKNMFLPMALYCLKISKEGIDE